jgi:hypothetical protein
VVAPELTAVEATPCPHAFPGGKIFFGDVTDEVGFVVGVPMVGTGVEFPVRFAVSEDPLRFFVEEAREI